MKKIEVAYCEFEDDLMTIDTQHIVWENQTIDEVIDTIKHNNPNNRKVALVYYDDVLRGNKPNGTREDFLDNPIIFGVAIYIRQGESRVMYE